MDGPIPTLIRLCRVKIFASLIALGCISCDNKKTVFIGRFNCHVSYWETLSLPTKTCGANLNIVST